MANPTLRARSFMEMPSSSASNCLAYSIRKPTRHGRKSRPISFLKYQQRNSFVVPNSRAICSLPSSGRVKTPFGNPTFECKPQMLFLRCQFRFGQSTGSHIYRLQTNRFLSLRYGRQIIIDFLPHNYKTTGKPPVKQNVTDSKNIISNRWQPHGQRSGYTNRERSIKAEFRPTQPCMLVFIVIFFQQSKALGILSAK